MCGSTHVPVEARLGHLCALQETHNEVIKWCFFPLAQALATVLQQVTVPLISQSQCMQYWGNSITSAMICAGGNGATSCQVRS